MNELPQIAVNVDLNWLTLIGTVLLPALVALVTKRLAPSGWKAGMLAVLSLLLGGVNEVVKAVEGGAVYYFDPNVFIPTVLSAFAAAYLLHAGLLGPANVTNTDGAIQRSVPGGIGPNVDSRP